MLFLRIVWSKHKVQETILIVMNSKLKYLCHIDKLIYLSEYYELMFNSLFSVFIIL